MRELKDWPKWVPDEVVAYLIHTRDGIPIRRLAKSFGCEPSTISRRIRRIENRRDDVLVDNALIRLESLNEAPRGATRGFKDTSVMTKHIDITSTDEAKVEREAKRVLRRLNEAGACLALAPAMETAVVVRDTGEGPAVRTAVVDRTVAEAMAIKGWIEASGQGRILRYRITAAGRAALKEFVAREESERAMKTGTAAERLEDDEVVADFASHAARKSRYSMAESPLLTLARRRDRDGNPFLTDDLVAAGERLREDFELAQVGAKVTQDWQHFLTGTVDLSRTGGSGVSDGAEGARARATAALAALGPGLGDVAVRCCCFLEGLESAERRMGWSARSGKIVLRIALQRLKAHYDQNAEHWSPLIG